MLNMILLMKINLHREKIGEETMPPESAAILNSADIQLYNFWESCFPKVRNFIVQQNIFRGFWDSSCTKIRAGDFLKL